MDPELKRAAERGDVEFLRECVAQNKPTDYYLSQTSYDDDTYNIFHLAVEKNRARFLREAITNILPPETSQLLLEQQSTKYLWKPLHLIVMKGNVGIVKLFLGVFKPEIDVSKRPWLAKDSQGQTPCHTALQYNQLECALEILRMDLKLFSNMVDGKGYSVMGYASINGLHQVALEILTSLPPLSTFSYACPFGYTPFHYVPNFTERGEEICRRLHERYPELIARKAEDGCSIFHSWAKEHKLWPFKWILKSKDIIPDFSRVFVDLVSALDSYNGHNPLHILAKNDISSKEDDLEIAKLLVESYKQQVAANSSISPAGHVLPWLRKDTAGTTPLDYAILEQKEQFALYLMSLDDNNYTLTPDTLLSAIEKKCHLVAQRILDMADDKSLPLFLTHQQKLKLQHLAPFWNGAENVIERLLKWYPELLDIVDENGNTVLHVWAKEGQVRPFEYFFKSSKNGGKIRHDLVKFISEAEYKEQNNPFHVLAATTNTTQEEEEEEEEESRKIAKILSEAYRSESPVWSILPYQIWPWFDMNSNLEGPMHLAIRNKQQGLALDILSRRRHKCVNDLLDVYKPEHKTIFLAIQHNCFQLAKELCKRLDKNKSKTKYLVDSSTDQSVLHLVSSHTGDTEFGEWLVNEAAELINHKDKSGKTALDKASEVGADKIIKAILKRDPSALTTSPLSWVEACKNGHVSALLAFMKHNPRKFKELCIEHKESPLHHIHFSDSDYEKYQEFLEIRGMFDFINLQDGKGDTPLHIAMQQDPPNMLLAEALLATNKVMHDIKNNNKIAVVDLLENKYNQDYKWNQMCKSIGFNPRTRTTFFQRKANLSDVRNSLSVVAALLATITFTAGFTLPGGLDQNTGKAMLAKKAAFLVFILSDTLAMCFSLLVLACLIWSMVYNDSNISLQLIDKSMGLLIPSLYCTLMAFMSGVYLVVSPKSLWAAIVVIVMCCFMGILAHKTLLRKVLFIQDSEKEVHQPNSTGESNNSREHNHGFLKRLHKLFKRKEARRNQDVERQNNE